MKTGVVQRKPDEIPAPMLILARNRMGNFVREFGRTIFSGCPMSLQCFAESCYLQGCEDMAHAAIKAMPEPPDFQI